VCGFVISWYVLFILVGTSFQTVCVLSHSSTNDALIACSLYGALHNVQSTKKKKAKKRRKEFSGVEDHVGRSGYEGLSIPPVGLSPSKGRRYTVSIALPGSIIDNAQTQELKTYLAGQVRGIVVCLHGLVSRSQTTSSPLLLYSDIIGCVGRIRSTAYVVYCFLQRTGLSSHFC